MDTYLHTYIYAYIYIYIETQVSSRALRHSSAGMAFDHDTATTYMQYIQIQTHTHIYIHTPTTTYMLTFDNVYQSIEASKCRLGVR